jgi:branched-chain amino acid transport system ATP-binding protein
MGLVPRSRGEVTLGGDDVTRLRTHAVVRRGVGYVPEDRDVFAGLTVLQIEPGYEEARRNLMALREQMLN